MRKVLVAILVLAAVGGAYYLGTKSNATPPAVPEKVEAPAPLVDNLIVPTGLKMPETLPSMKIDEPAKVLAGEVKVPVDLLRTEPPAAQPNFVVPKLSK